MNQDNFVLDFILDKIVSDEATQLLAQLEREDFASQFWDGKGRVAELGQENGEPKLDWLNGLQKILAHPERLDDLLVEAQTILTDSKIKYIVWSGMGGSVQTVHTLKNSGLLTNSRFTMHILDSTDPNQLNALLQTIGEVEIGPQNYHLSYTHAGAAYLEAALLQPILEATLLIGVSMGMTSEEPITHLRWFVELLTDHNIAPENHLRVLTLPGSYLHKFADEYKVKRLELQLDGGSATPGRMSAPTTKVFLLPVALELLGIANGEIVQAKNDMFEVLRQAQNLYRYNVLASLGETNELKLDNDPFIKLGAIIAAKSRHGLNKVIVATSSVVWQALFPWIEQIVEESLGKNGKGFLIFYNQKLSSDLSDCFTININSSNTNNTNPNIFNLNFPAIPDSKSAKAVLLRRLILMAAFFASFKKTIVTYAYLENIVFAGQPAVEGYKRYARELRDSPTPIVIPPPGQYQSTFGSLTLDYGAVIQSGLIDTADLVTELQRFELRPSETAETDKPQSYATLRDQRMLYRIIQAQVEQHGFISGTGILEITDEGFGLLNRFLPGLDDVTISQELIQNYDLHEGDEVSGEASPPNDTHRYFNIRSVQKVNGQAAELARLRPTKGSDEAARTYAALLNLAKRQGKLGYADLTFNGLPDAKIQDELQTAQQNLFNQQLKIPAKLRLAPQDYHSTEQSETDGPNELVSLRLVAASHTPVIAGDYADRFLLAQSLGTRQAMQDARRWILMLYLLGDIEQTTRDLHNFFAQTQIYLKNY